MKYFLLTISLFFLLGCSTDDNSENIDDDQANPQEVLLLKKVFKDGVLLRTLEYYDNDKLKTQTGFFVDDTFAEMRYEYDADTIYIYYYVENEFNFLFTKSYEINNSTSRMDYYNSYGDLTNYNIYSFENNSCGVSFLERFNEDGYLISNVLYNYIDENCSFEATFDDPNYKNGHTLKDNKKSYEEFVISPILRQEISHNTLESMIWDDNDQLITNYSYTSEFEYNSDDYPTKETKTYLDGDILIYTLEYY